MRINYKGLFINLFFLIFIIISFIYFDDLNKIKTLLVGAISGVYVFGIIVAILERCKK